MNFMNVLSGTMDDAGVGVKKLEDILVDKGVYNINFRSISDYKNGVHTPSYSKAKALLDALDYKVTEDELLSMLEQNKKDIKENNDYLYSDNVELRRTIRIKLKRLLPGVEPEVAERYLKDRIQSIYGDETRLSIYIQNLISKDLKQYILEEDDIENEY